MSAKRSILLFVTTPTCNNAVSCQERFLPGERFESWLQAYYFMLPVLFLYQDTPIDNTMVSHMSLTQDCIVYDFCKMTKFGIEELSHDFVFEFLRVAQP